jgi:hypothetical protein
MRATLLPHITAANYSSAALPVIRQIEKNIGRRNYLWGTSRISILHPTAFAYRFMDDKDGACFPADSSRETALFDVPIRDATAS